jgi:hypothetical protein
MAWNTLGHAHHALLLQPFEEKHAYFACRKWLASAHAFETNKQEGGSDISVHVGTALAGAMIIFLPMLIYGRWC